MKCGAVASLNASIMFLSNYKSQLEYSMGQIAEKQMNLAWQSSALAGQNAVNSPQYQQLQHADNLLSLQLKQLETQQKSVSTLLESLQNALDQNIKNVYKVDITA